MGCQVISLDDYLTASGKYKDRKNHPEVTEEVIKNAERLLKAVNELLKQMGISKVSVSSGFRPSSTNASIGGAKKSLHMVGLAIDLADPHGDLDALIDMNDPLKKKLGLWQEDSASTKGWVHLDLKDRGKRAKNTFKP